MTASTVSERIEDLLRPPVDSSPRPSLMCRPRSMVRATSARARALTTAARSFARRPSDRSGWARNSVSVTTTPRTESPRNSSRSLVGSPPFSYANDRCVKARSSCSASSVGVPSASRRSSYDERSATGVAVRGPDDGLREDRTGRSRGRRGAAGAWRRRRGWRTSPVRGRRPSTASDGDACCYATSFASGQPLNSLLLSAGDAAGHLVVFSSVSAQRQRSEPGPTWVDLFLVLVAGSVCEPDAAFGAQSRAVVLAQRLERQLEHLRIPQHRFEVEQVALEPADVVILLVALGVVLLVDEELLEVGHGLVADLHQAPNALPDQLGSRRAGDEDSLHDRLEPEVQLDRRSFGHAQNLDAEVCRRRCGAGHPS